MRTIPYSCSLVGVETVPIDVVVNGDQVFVVDPATDHALHSVRLESFEPALLEEGTGVSSFFQEGTGVSLNAAARHPRG
jgi:hypothetical protein